MTAADLSEVDLTDLDLFADGFPHDVFALHRREAPVWWHEPTAHTPDGEGFWSVATHAEVLEVLRDPVTYSSERGGDRRHGGTLLQDIEFAGLVLNMMDDPRHARIRRLVTTGLTPAHGPAARGRAPAAHPGAARRHRRRCDGRLPRDGGGRAPHAGHLHPARRPRGRPPRALAGGRPRLRHPARATPASRTASPRPTRPACSSTAARSSPRSGSTPPTTCSRSSCTRSWRAPIRHSSPTWSSTPSSRCSSRRARRRPATRSPAACSRSSTTPTSATPC